MTRVTSVVPKPWLVTHGRSGTPLYSVWKMLFQRCYNPKNAQYKNYGGRGIAVCKRWHRFENFYADMGDPPFKGASIERKHNDQNYSKKNCKWATLEEQGRNKRCTLLVTFQGVSTSLKDLLCALGRSQDYSLIRQRLQSYNWPLDKALFTP